MLSLVASLLLTAGTPSDQAKELFSAAQKLYEQSRFAEAAAKFETAFALTPTR